jgi:hypothetical protein
MKTNQTLKSVLIGFVVVLGVTAFTNASAQRNQRFDRTENIRDRRENKRDRREDRLDR